MSQAPAMPLFCDAYLADTMHLSNEESGCYMKLLMVTWRNNGKPLPDDDKRMARTLAISATKWRDRIRPRLVEFFDVSDGSWRQKRLEKEWIFCEKIRAEQSRKGKLGGRPKSLKNNDIDKAGALSGLKPSESPLTHTLIDSELPIGSSSGTGAPPILPPIDLKSTVFGPIRAWLEASSGRSEKQVRSWLGRCCGEYGDGNVIMASARVQAGPPPVDPFSALKAELQRSAGKNGHSPKRNGAEKSHDIAEGLADALMALGVDAGISSAGLHGRGSECAGGGGIVIDAV